MIRATESKPRFSVVDPLPTGPGISVICTIRNGAGTASETIRSILDQTFSDLELLVIDDGSTDDTGILVQALAAEDRRVRFIQPGAVGRGKALNLALKEARADLIANVDVDDPSHPERLEAQYRVMTEHPEIGVLCSSLVFVHGDEAPEWSPLKEPCLTEVTGKLTRHNPVCHSSVLMRKSVVMEVGGYDESRDCKFDYDLWVRLAIAGQRIYRLEQPLASKRFHDGQSFDNDRRFVWKTAPVQIRAIRGLCGGWRDWASVGLRTLWYFLPAKFRWSRHRSRMR